jgi:hypothetical protein
MRVDNSLLDGIAASSSAAKSTSKSTKSPAEKSSFSSALKSATAKTSSDSTSTSDSTTSSKSAAETTKAVDGHQYADILTGPRAGLYLNTGHNARSGEAFVMVKRNGREYHIYGTGKDRVVIGLKTAAEKKSASTTGTDDASTTSTTGTTDAGKITTDASTTATGS